MVLVLREDQLDDVTETGTAFDQNVSDLSVIDDQIPDHLDQLFCRAEPAFERFMTFFKDGGYHPRNELVFNSVSEEGHDSLIVRL